MTDPELSAPEEARLRRLLADARHTAPVPDDVVGRLDDVLARLQAEEPVLPPSREPERSQPDPVVVALDAQRRRTLRRRVAGGLLAAAALVVGGVTVPPLLSSSMMGGADAESSSGDSAMHGAESADVPRANGAPGAVATLPPVEDLPTASVDDPSAFEGHASASALDSIDEQARRNARPPLPCRSAAWGAGRRLPVVFGDGADRQAGVAVVRAASSDGSRRVDLYVCGRSEPVGSLELPTR